MYGKRAAAAMGSPPRGVLSPTRDGGAGAAVANAASTSAADVALTLSIVADDATDERRKRHRDDEVVEGGGGGGSTTASSITLREAGQTLALVEELTYQIVRPARACVRRACDLPRATSPATSPYLNRTVFRRASLVSPSSPCPRLRACWRIPASAQCCERTVSARDSRVLPSSWGAVLERAWTLILHSGYLPSQ